MIYRPYGPAYERTQADELACRVRINPRNVPSNYFSNAPECAPTLASPSGDDRSADLVSRRDGEASSSPQVGTCAVGVCTAGGGERSHAAGTPNCNDALRLRAARVIFGRAQS